MDKKFDVIVLGSAGGLSEDNLTAYLIGSKGSNDFLSVDAGSLFSGLQKANAMGSFAGIEVPDESPLSLEGWILQNHIKAYLVSHAHLDHIAGLIINSTDDLKKKILGCHTTIDYLRDHIFNWKIWPNFGNEGVPPHMNKYVYVRLTPAQEYVVPDTAITVTPFKVSHSVNYESTAFLIQSDGYYILFVGDTGSDPVEKSKYLELIWAHITPLIQSTKLRAIFLEASYPNDRPDDLLFGHLTPSWMIHELYQLACLVNPDQPQKALSDIPVVVTSIKPSLNKKCTKKQITEQLHQLNELSIKFIIPSQGERFEF